MYSKDGGACVGLATVDTPFVRQSPEAELDDGLVERLIPDPTGLFHAV
jgi:hypothetical protein